MNLTVPLTRPGGHPLPIPATGIATRAWGEGRVRGRCVVQGFNGRRFLGSLSPVRCLLSILGLAVIARCAPEGHAAARGAEVTTTVYVGRHFEVRDHDQPVKYVFNGDVRVAHITGSLSANMRLQRWRLQSGWNLVSLAVTATNVDGQLQRFTNGPDPLVQALYRWQHAASSYRPVVAGETIEAGSALWLRARTNGIVTLIGSYVEPVIPLRPHGGGYLASSGLQSWTPMLPAGTAAWKYEAGGGVWRMALGAE